MFRIRPARNISFYFMLVGIVFVTIGITVIVPIIHWIGILLTACAAGITIYHGLNVFGRKRSSLLIVERKMKR